MTQNDLRNERLLRLIGVAPDCPAEFVIFWHGEIENSKASVIRLNYLLTRRIHGWAAVA